jgi:hypothetical protein
VPDSETTYCDAYVSEDGDPCLNEPAPHTLHHPDGQMERYCDVHKGVRDHLLELYELTGWDYAQADRLVNLRREYFLEQLRADRLRPPWGDIR